MNNHVFIPVTLAVMALGLVPSCGASSDASGTNSGVGGGSSSGGALGAGTDSVGLTGGGDSGGFSSTVGGTTSPQSSSSAGNGASGFAAQWAPCLYEQVGTFACDVDTPNTSLECDVSTLKWQFNETCLAGEICDAQPGATPGICHPPPIDCAGHSPGESFCLTDVQAWKCGDSGTTATWQQDCALFCYQGQCISADGCPTADRVVACGAGCSGNLATDCTGRICASATTQTEITVLRGLPVRSCSGGPTATIITVDGPDCGPSSGHYLKARVLSQGVLPTYLSVVPLNADGSITDSICPPLDASNCVVAKAPAALVAFSYGYPTGNIAFEDSPSQLRCP